MLGGDASRATVAIWVAAVLLGGFALLHLAGGRGSDGGAPVRIDRAPAPAGAGGSPGGGGIYVHVAGAVRQPGLVHLDDGARVAEALERAGGPGPRAELAGVNLAARLEDGQQVIVPVRGAGAAAPVPAAPGGAGGAAPPGAAGVPKPSLGAATVEQLDQIDGIGPTLAKRIIQYRTEHGGFRSLAQLREVEGIGEKRFEGLREALQP